MGGSHTRPPTRCHSPRKRGIQYAGLSRLNYHRLWNTGCPAFAGHDNGEGVKQHPRDAISRPGLAIRVPLKTEGAGNAGCTPHPLPCVQTERNARRPTQVRRNHSGTPCAMALRLTPRSPWCAGLFSHHREWIISTRLIPASGEPAPAFRSSPRIAAT